VWLLLEQRQAGFVLPARASGGEGVAPCVMEGWVIKKGTAFAPFLFLLLPVLPLS